MVPLRSKWSLRPDRWRRAGRSGVAGGPDTHPSEAFGLPSATPLITSEAPHREDPVRSPLSARPIRTVGARPWAVSRHRLVAVTGGLVVTLAAVGLVARSQRAVATPRPPVLGAARVAYNGDLGDPFILPVQRDGAVVSYVAFGTGDWPAVIPTARSTDLATWQKGLAKLADDPNHQSGIDTWRIAAALEYAGKNVRIGFADGLVRLSVGIEDLDDLRADVDRALAAT